jgi:hypothetical protein
VRVVDLEADLGLIAGAGQLTNRDGVNGAAAL